MSARDGARCCALCGLAEGSPWHHGAIGGHAFARDADDVDADAERHAAGGRSMGHD